MCSNHKASTLPLQSNCTGKKTEDRIWCSPWELSGGTTPTESTAHHWLRTSPSSSVIQGKSICILASLLLLFLPISIQCLPSGSLLVRIQTNPMPLFPIYSPQDDLTYPLELTNLGVQISTQSALLLHVTASPSITDLLDFFLVSILTLTTCSSQSGLTKALSLYLRWKRSHSIPTPPYKHPLPLLTFTLPTLFVNEELRGFSLGHLLWKCGVIQAFKPYCQFMRRTEELIKQEHNQQNPECGKP